MTKRTEFDRRKFLIGTAALASASLRAGRPARRRQGAAHPDLGRLCRARMGRSLQAGDRRHGEYRLYRFGRRDVRQDAGLAGRRLRRRLLRYLALPALYRAKLHPAVRHDARCRTPATSRRNFEAVQAVMRGDERYGMPFAWGSLPLVYDATPSRRRPNPGR